MASVNHTSQGQLEVRERLIQVARECFIAMPYEKVSIRLIGEKAGVNMAMIRYYFGNKLGLFEAMITELVAPMCQHTKQLAQAADVHSITDMVNSFYQLMIPNPDFPKFLFRLVTTETSKEAQEVVINMFFHLVYPYPLTAKDAASADESDLMLTRMSLLSLMVFPFLMPEPLAKLHGFQLDAAFYQKLAVHNIKLLEQGLQGEKQ